MNDENALGMIVITLYEGAIRLDHSVGSDEAAFRVTRNVSGQYFIQALAGNEPPEG